MTFAHDLVLVTEHASHMSIALYECQKFFKQKGLKVNARKCSSMCVLLVKDKESIKVVTDTY